MMIRKIFLTLVVMLSALVGTHAEETTDNFYINDFSIAPGETKEVDVYLQSTQPYRGFQVNIYLPEGLEALCEYYDDYNDEYRFVNPNSDRNPRNFEYRAVLVDDGSLMIAAKSANNKTAIAAGDGAVFTIKLKASNDLAGTVYIDLKNSRMAGHEEPYVNVSFHGPDTRCEVTVTQNSSNVTLYDLCMSGKENNIYTLTDVLVAVACVEDIDKNIYLLCKDENTSVDATYNTNKYEDYMMEHEGGFTGKQWDQSNWIALYFKSPDSEEANKIHELVGKRLAEGTVTGSYYKLYGVNHYLEMLNTDLELFDNQLVGYIPNRYCPANFLQENIDKDGATGHGDYSDRHYFFMNPKIQEVCEITFAVWNGNYFVLPAPQGNMNSTDIYGAVNAMWDYNSYSNPDLTVGVAYKFKAIVQKGLQKKSSISSLKGETQTVTPGEYNPDNLNDINTYVVYPFDFDPNKQENIVTAINTITVNGEVKSVKYVNVAGLESDRPFPGVNIVVTEYTDGSRQSTKIIIK